jgi:hypothetical protein
MTQEEERAAYDFEAAYAASHGVPASWLRERNVWPHRCYCRRQLCHGFFMARWDMVKPEADVPVRVLRHTVIEDSHVGPVPTRRERNGVWQA